MVEVVVSVKLAPALIAWVPELKLRVRPAAILKIPVWMPFPPRDRVPLFTLTVPELLKPVQLFATY